MAVNMKILDLANHLNRTKTGARGGILYGDPEYMILEPVVTDDMADVGMFLGFRQKRSAAEIAQMSTLELKFVTEQLLLLADAGVCFVNEIEGVDYFWTDLWVPGIMEMMANHPTNVQNFPQIAEAFNNYGIVRGAKTVGNFPVGVGLMRVIPIEMTISGETRRASYEEVSKYLNDNDKFCVSDCSCRTVRKSMGEGCGHLSEDMCIQMGHAAEYYVRTGRAREITREEAFEIIKKAEENGLMHQIPNTDGKGKTHAICNCCGCSCLSLRTANMFYNNDMVRSNYVSVVDPEKCVACGQCVEHCPVNAAKLGQKLCAKEEPAPKPPRETPRDNNWPKEKWNPGFRTNRENVTDAGTAPCKTECPAHIGIQGYIKLAAQGKYTEALELIKKDNPFPAVCGRICPRKCEQECTRGDIDDPVAIDEIKKFIAEQDLNEKNRFIPKKRHEYGKKIAIIGAGPAGLSCAYYLGLDGYKVTVFEKQKALGGMLTLGIPSYRLEKNVVNAEIDILKGLGVEFKTGVEVGKDVTISKLREEGYKAFYVAVGAQSGRKLGIDGEKAEGVIAGVDFLREVNLGNAPKLSGKTIVIGGGNVAIDVARTAVRVGSENVSMFCLESRETMPALEEEILEAIAEDIEVNNAWGPKRILVENGKVKGVEFVKCVSTIDDSGKFNPVYDNSNIKLVEAENVLLSVGQSIDLGKIFEGSKTEFNPNNTIKADPTTYQTAQTDIFVGGDVYTGPKFAIDAIAAGKEGAISIHRFVQPGQDLLIGRDRKEYHAIDKNNVVLEGYDNTPRQTSSHVDGSKSKQTFKDLRSTFTEEQMRKEAERCLGCGASVVDEYVCVGCGQCVTKCKFDAISLHRVYDEEGVEAKDIRPTVAKTMVKRKVKIAARSVKRALTGK